MLPLVLVLLPESPRSPSRLLLCPNSAVLCFLLCSADPTCACLGLHRVNRVLRDPPAPPASFQNPVLIAEITHAQHTNHAIQILSSSIFHTQADRRPVRTHNCISIFESLPTTTPHGIALVAIPSSQPDIHFDSIQRRGV